VNVYRRSVAVCLLILLPGLPSTAQTGADPSKRDFAFPVGRLTLHVTPAALEFFFRSATGRVLRGDISRVDGTFRLEGLMIQPTNSGLSFSFGGDEATAKVNQSSVSEGPAVSELMARWRETQDLAAVQGLELALRTAIAKHAADRGLQADQMELSCGWEFVGLVGATAVGYAGCTTFIACAGGYLLFVYQLKQTANACNWCGFGRAC
jgi:hypothetical protein